jgi:hypothetical protein
MLAVSQTANAWGIARTLRVLAFVVAVFFVASITVAIFNRYY